MKKRRSNRIIELLRKCVKGKWVYDQKLNIYIHESGREAFRCSVMRNRYEGDDDSFYTSVRWVDTGEEIFFWFPPGHFSRVS